MPRRCDTWREPLSRTAPQTKAERRAADAEQQRSEAVALAKLESARADALAHEAGRDSVALTEELKRLKTAHRTREATLERQVHSRAHTHASVA